MEFTLTYGRVVILERTIEAESAERAWLIAGQLEHDGDLDLSDVKSSSSILSITDYDEVWELEEDN